MTTVGSQAAIRTFVPFTTATRSGVHHTVAMAEQTKKRQACALALREPRSGRRRPLGPTTQRKARPTGDSTRSWTQVTDISAITTQNATIHRAEPSENSPIHGISRRIAGVPSRTRRAKWGEVWKCRGDSRDELT